MNFPVPIPRPAGTGGSTQLSTLHVFCMLGVVCFVTHFLWLPQFGLYEDDYFYVIPVFDWDWSSWWIQLKEAVIHPIQGRPLNHAMRRTLFFLSLNHGGLQSAYLVGWSLVTINALLVFTFVHRALSAQAAVAAALLYIVYPIDTSRQVLMHQTDLILGTSVLLTALNLYARGWRVSGFAVAGLGLINYESFYLPFLAAPLLLASREPITWRRLLGHGLAFIGIAGSVLLARKFLGESRATEMLGGLGDVTGKMLSAGPIGAWHSLKATGQRPLDALLHAAPYALVLGLAVGFLTVWCVARSGTSEASSRPQASALVWIASGAVLAWLVSYLLAFREGYYPPVVSIGRLTGVHTPGTFGAAMLCAVLVEFTGRLRIRPLRATSAILFGGLIGFSAAYGLEIQRSEYVAHWAKQTEFYQTMIELTGDLREGEVIVLDAEGDRDALPITQGFPRFGMVNYTPLAFAKYATWPSDWKIAPQVAVIWKECPAVAAKDGLALFTPPWRFQPVPNSAELPRDVPIIRDNRFIYLTAQDGILRRQSGPVAIRGHLLNARAPSHIGTPNLTASSLFKKLTTRFEPAAWFTLRNARNYPH